MTYYEHERGWIAQRAYALMHVPEWNDMCAPTLIEFATRVGSELGKAGTKAGINVIRMTIDGPRPGN